MFPAAYGNLSIPNHHTFLTHKVMTPSCNKSLFQFVCGGVSVPSFLQRHQQAVIDIFCGCRFKNGNGFDYLNFLLNIMKTLYDIIIPKQHVHRNIFFLIVFLPFLHPRLYNASATSALTVYPLTATYLLHFKSK